LFAVIPTGVLLSVAAMCYACNIMKKVDYMGSLSDYKKSVGKNDDKAETRRQSAMGEEAVKKFLNNKYGSAVFSQDALEYDSAEMFADVIIGDVIGEGSIRDKFPSSVWEPATEKWLGKIWEKEKKANKRSKKK